MLSVAGFAALGDDVIALFFRLFQTQAGGHRKRILSIRRVLLGFHVPFYVRTGTDRGERSGTLVGSVKKRRNQSEIREESE